MSSHGVADDDLDDILDSALDDFAKAPKGVHPVPDVASSLDPGKANLEAECDVPVTRETSASSSIPEGAEEVKGLGMPALGKKKKGQKGKKPVSQGAGEGEKDKILEGGVGRKGAEGVDKTAGKQQQQSGGSGEGKQKKTKKELKDTLEQLAAQTRQTVEGMRASEEASSGREEGEEEAGGGEEEMMEKLMKQFEDMGTGDIQGLMDTMLQQLLSKDVLQEPMAEIRDRYPDWLSANSSKLTPDDLSRYTRQYECIQRLCHLYETRPDDFTTILAVMKEMQECGQPPADIIQDLAPGLEIGEDGLPMIPDLGSGDLPPNCGSM